MPLIDSAPVPVLVNVTSWVFTVLRLFGVAKSKFVTDKVADGVDCAEVFKVPRNKSAIH
jgi:hypothetical protein